MRQDIRPLLRAVDHAKNARHIRSHDIGEDVRQAGNDEFARPGDTAGPSAFRKVE